MPGVGVVVLERELLAHVLMLVTAASLLLTALPVLRRRPEQLILLDHHYATCDGSCGVRVGGADTLWGAGDLATRNRLVAARYGRGALAVRRAGLAD